MATPNHANLSESRSRYWLRVLRPLFWWLLLVLAMFGYRKHQEWMARTRIEFSISLQNQAAIDAEAKLDGVPVSNIQNISLGYHTLSISHPKADPFQTNFFAWYGPHNLGEIKLKRSMGTLRIQSTPSASSIAVAGPEFSATFENTANTNLTLPTDQYVVRASYPHWTETQKPTVFAITPASCNFAPSLGALRLACNKSNATYRLEFASGQSMDYGDMPATIVGVPAGRFEMTTSYHDRQIKQFVTVITGVTNDVPVQFVFGVAQLETMPAGANVSAEDGTYLGQTPLALPDMPTQTTKFNLSLPGYEPVSVALTITADQTNVCRTNLISLAYVSDMQDARRYMAISNFVEVVQSTSMALDAKPGDIEALALQNKANSFLEAERQRQEKLRQQEEERVRQEQEKLRLAQEKMRQEQAKLARPKQMFDNLCEGYQDAGLFTAKELKTGKPAKALAGAILAAMTNAPSPFKVLRNEWAAADNYEIEAQQTFGLGILGGTERDCLIVVGQAKDDETQVWFKVLEYQVKHTYTVINFKYEDRKQLTPVNFSQTLMGSDSQALDQEGIKIVTDKIQSAIAQ